MGITPQDARRMMDAYNKVYAPKEEPATETPEVETAPPETENTSD
tara:strand:+ start:33 stop:167 length:135 start_codon:yes stop_codon:yes gene_type:complete